MAEKLFWGTIILGGLGIWAMVNAAYAAGAV